MNVSSLETIEQIREFLNGTADIAFSNPADESSLHTFVGNVIRRYRHFRLTKGQRGVLFAYTQRLTGYSRQNLSRLVAQYRETKSLKPLKRSLRPVSIHKPSIQSPPHELIRLRFALPQQMLRAPAASVWTNRAYR